VLTSNHACIGSDTEFVNQHFEGRARGVAQMREAEEAMRAVSHLHRPNWDAAGSEPIGVTAGVVS
jgi:hypothetical protein